MTNISDLDVESDKIVNRFNQKLMFKYRLKFLKNQLFFQKGNRNLLKIILI